MMKTLRFFFVAALAMIVSNISADTYKLEQVTSVTDGGLYVFEQGGHVMGSTVSNSALQTLTEYKTTGLSGTEAYVWKLESATDGYHMKNNSLSANEYLKNSSGTGVSLVASNATPSIWVFNFQNDNTFLIQNKSNSDRFLGFMTATNYTYKAYATSNLSTYPHAIVVYQLVSVGDTRTATTIEFDEGFATRATCGKDESVKLPNCQVKAGGTPIDATVEWSIEKKSGNDDLAGAAISGNTITIPNHSYGTLQVTASYKGDAQNKPSTKPYTLTVYKGYMNIAEFLVDYAKSNSEIDATGFPVSFWSLTANEGTITGYNDVTVTYVYTNTNNVNGSYTYINDGANDLVLFGNSLGLKQGDVLTSNLGSGNVGAIYGTIKSYNGLLELVVTAADFEFTKKSEGATITPKTLDIANISDLTNMNAYLKVENAEYVKKSDDGKVFTFKVGTTEFNVRNQFNSNVSFEEGAIYTIEGMGAIYTTSGSSPVYQLFYVASEKTAESGIAAVKAAKAEGAMFNLAGQQVAKGYKGLVIVNGKKVLK